MAAPRVDTILEIKDHIAAYVALVSGQFEEEITRLQEVKSQAEYRLQQADALETFDKVKADVDAYQVRKLAEIDEAAQALKDFEASLKIKETALATNQANFQAERTGFLAKSQQLDLDAASLRDQAAAMNKEAATTLAKAKERETAVASREASVAAREAEVQRKMDVLKNL